MGWNCPIQPAGDLVCAARAPSPALPASGGGSHVWPASAGTGLRSEPHALEAKAIAMITQSNVDTLVTVFGGSGFLGRHLVRALCRRGYRVRVAVRRPE